MMECTNQGMGAVGYFVYMVEYHGKKTQTSNPLKDGKYVVYSEDILILFYNNAI